jgi:TolA-binding protein
MRSNCLFIALLGIVLTGCHSHPATKMIAVPPPTIVTRVVAVAAPVPAPMNIPVSLPEPPDTGLFDQAEAAFDMGQYPEAIQDYEQYLQSFPDGFHTERVLFHLGVAYVLQTKPPANWTRATASLTLLIKEHPDSPLSPTANLILSLHSLANRLTRDAKAKNEVVQQLNGELEKLKKIDSDRRKRP